MKKTTPDSKGRTQEALHTLRTAVAITNLGNEILDLGLEVARGALPDIVHHQARKKAELYVAELEALVSREKRLRTRAKSLRASIVSH